MLDKLAAVEARYEELGREMARPELAGDYERLQALAREDSSLEDVVPVYPHLRRLSGTLARRPPAAPRAAPPAASSRKAAPRSSSPSPARRSSRRRPPSMRCRRSCGSPRCPKTPSPLKTGSWGGGAPPGG